MTSPTTTKYPWHEIIDGAEHTLHFDTPEEARSFVTNCYIRARRLGTKAFVSNRPANFHELPDERKQRVMREGLSAMPRAVKVQFAVDPDDPPPMPRRGRPPSTWASEYVDSGLWIITYPDPNEVQRFRARLTSWAGVRGYNVRSRKVQPAAGGPATGTGHSGHHALRFQVLHKAEPAAFFSPLGYPECSKTHAPPDLVKLRAGVPKQVCSDCGGSLTKKKKEERS